MTFDDIADSLVGGTVWGLGVAAVAGTVLLVGKGARPLAKQAVKGYLVLSERARELQAEAAEQLEDIYAEVRAEIVDDDASGGGDEAPDLHAPSGGPKQGGQ